MFVIRSQQEARLKEGARLAFVMRVEEHVRAVDPKGFGALDAARLRQFVERNWELSRNFGIKSERGLCGYLEIVCSLGEDFGTKYKWAGEILKSADYEDRKLTRLRSKIAEMPVLSEDAGSSK